MLRKRAAALLLAVILASGAMPAQAASTLSMQERAVETMQEAKKTGWQTANGKKYYYVNGKQASGKTKIGNDWYYFGPEMKTGLIHDTAKKAYYYAGKNGVLQTGWKTIGNKKYYFWGSNNNGHTMYEAALGKRSVNGTWYLFTNDGVLLYGLNTADGKLYYTDSKGRLQTGLKTINGRKYYFETSGDDRGEAHIGFKTVNDKKYYFSPEAMTGFFKKNSAYYYAGSDGAFQTGWKTVSGKKYYFWGSNNNGHTKYEAALGKRSVNGTWYLFTNDGVLLTGLSTFEGKLYLTDKDGKLKKGWQEVSGKKYYFDQETFAALTGRQSIDGRGYIFNSDGTLKQETVEKPAEVKEGDGIYIPANLSFRLENGGKYRIVDNVPTCRGTIRYIGYDQHKWSRNIDGSGCGLCSFLTVISTFKGNTKVNADDYKASKLKKVTGASKCPISLYAGTKMLQAEGIRYEWVKVLSKSSNTAVYNDILSHLKKGMPVIVALSPNTRTGRTTKAYTNSGHYATLIGVTQDGKKAYLLDSGARVARYVDLKDICWNIPTARANANNDPVWSGWGNAGGYVKVFP